MHTTEQAVAISRRRRRRHSAEFKAEAVAACQQPGVSIAAAALARGLNANLLRRWVIEAERAGSVAISTSSKVPSVRLENRQGSESFIPVSLPPRADEGLIRIEVRRGASTVCVQWPTSAAQECALLLRELMR